MVFNQLGSSNLSGKRLIGKNIILFLFTLIIISSVTVFAQSGNVTVSGFVRDSGSGEALIGTNILLYKDSLALKYPPFAGAATNTYGFYALPGLSEGTYYIIVRNIGYKTIIRKITVTVEEGRVQYNFNMTPENIKLQEVIVEGKKQPEINPSTIDVSPALLKQLPSLSGEIDLFKILQLLPGVKVASEISNGIYVRGGSPDQTLTLVDGVIDYNPSHLSNFASTFNSDAIQSVRLIKGAFPAEYGGRLGSVLDIKLRSGTKEKEKGKVGLGLINSNFMFEGPIGEKTTYMFAGRKMYYDLIQNSYLKSNIIPRYNFYDMNAKLTITASNSNIYTLSGLYSQDNLYNPANSNGIDYNIQWKNALASLKWLHVNSKSLFITTTLSFIDYEFKSILEDNTGIAAATSYYSLSKLQDVYGNINAESYWSKNNTIKAGTEIALHNYSLVYSNFYNTALENTLNEYPNIFSMEAAVYVQNESKIANWLRTNIGVRGYYFRSKKYFSLEPRLSAQFILNENLSINAAYAIAHQFLHLIVRNDITLPTDLWYPSTENVSPSKSTQYVLGCDYNLFNKQYIFSIEGYYKDLKNLYDFENAPTFKIGESISDLLLKGKGEAYGVEFFMNKTVGNITGWIGYTLSWTKRKYDLLNAGKIFYPRYDRRHDISLVLAYNLNEHWNFGLTWSYATGQGYTVPTGQYQFQTIGPVDQNILQFNYTDRNAYRLPSYNKLDLNATYRFNWGNYSFETYLNLFNVYNRHNPFSYYITYTKQPGAADASESYPVPTLNQITLFPFVPSVGINIKF